jgi:hypothetical protein
MNGTVHGGYSSNTLLSCDIISNMLFVVVAHVNREQYQGVGSPVSRDESNFDPGAKYHVPANIPYFRYFLAK